ncbi:TPA: polysaccharide biosynthesis tyrosine autokinase [Streptococcus suis]|nr:polysaccharide biosynthesis tyrosine autokinase [Streptococcus suis]
MDKELSLIAIVKLVKEKLRWIVLTIVVFVVATVFYSTAIAKPLYSSSAELLVSPKATDNLQLTLNQLQTNSKLIQTYESIIFSDDILTLVNSEVSTSYSNQELRNKIKVVTEDESQTFAISVTDTSPETAAEIANTVSAIFQSKLDDYYSSNLEIKVISAAKPSTNQVSPIISRNIFFAAVLATVVSSFVIILLELLSPTIKGTAILSTFSWLELGNVSLSPLQMEVRGATKEHPKSGLFNKKSTQKSISLDNIEGIKTKLQTQLDKNAVKTFLISSAESGTGKTTLAMYLANSLANNGKKVLLVDANLRNPSLDRIYKLSNKVGLFSYLQNGGELGIQAIQGSSLFVLPSGPKFSAVSQILTSEKLPTLLADLEKHFDVILFDSAALNGVPDAQILATKIRNLVMLVKQDGTRIDDLIEANRFLESYQIEVLGYVFDGTVREREGALQQLFYKVN